MFSISSNEVVLNGQSAVDYWNNLAYRPFSESSLNVTLAVDVNISGTLGGTPQIYARLSPDDIDSPSGVTAISAFSPTASTT